MIDISKGRYWDLPWSLVSSCTRCSPGCEHCWSLAMEKRFHKGVEGKIEVHPERLSVPLKRKKPTVYAIWNDLFHEDVKDGFQEQTYRVIWSVEQHTFLILTKRPQNMLRFVEWYTEHGVPFPENIWHGLTVVNQQEADEKIPIFLRVPGKKFLSIEPCLGPISLRWMVAWDGMATKPYPETTNHLDGLRLIDGVILGAETGPGARFMDLQWVRGIRNECEEAGVPFFLKHVSKEAGRMLDGRTHNDLPWHKTT